MCLSNAVDLAKPWVPLHPQPEELLSVSWLNRMSMRATRRTVRALVRVGVTLVFSISALSGGAAEARAKSSASDYVRNFGDQIDVWVAPPVVDAADKLIFVIRYSEASSHHTAELFQLNFADRVVHTIFLPSPPGGNPVLGPRDLLYLVTGNILSIYNARTLQLKQSVRLPADTRGPTLAGSRIWLLNDSETFHDEQGVYSTPLRAPGPWTFSLGANKLDVSGSNLFLAGRAALSPYLEYVDDPVGVLHLKGATPTEEPSSFVNPSYKKVSFYAAPAAPSANGSGYIAQPVIFTPNNAPDTYGSLLYRPSDLLHPIGGVVEPISGVGAVTISPNAHTVIESNAEGYVVQRWSAPSKITLLKSFSNGTELQPPVVTPDGRTMIYVEIHGVDSSTGSHSDQFLHIDRVHIRDWSS